MVSSLVVVPRLFIVSHPMLLASSIWNFLLRYLYRGLLYSAQNIVKKDPGRARQNSLATAQTNFTKPGAQNKGDLCILTLPFPTPRSLAVCAVEAG